MTTTRGVFILKLAVKWLLSKGVNLVKALTVYSSYQKGSGKYKNYQSKHWACSVVSDAKISAKYRMSVELNAQINGDK